MIETYLSLVSELSRPVCRALFDSLWQGALAALGLFIMLKIVRVGYARIRYTLACLAIVLIPVLTVSSFIDHYDFDRPVTATVTEAATPAIDTGLDTSAETDHSVTLPAVSVLTQIREALSPWLFFVWLGGVWLLSFYHLIGWVRIRISLKGAAEPFDTVLTERFRQLAKALALSRPVRVVKSLTADVPCVVDWVKPMVLIPVAALNGLSSDELEMIIVHELAHIKRHDILINYLQTVLETLFFFNPAVWYISRRIRLEREHCCDDTAVKITGDKMKYAKALANLEELRAGTSRLAPAATTGSLLERIRRLVLPSAADRSTGSALVNIFPIVLLAAALFSLQGLVPDRAAAEIDLAKTDKFESKRSDLKGEWELFRGNRKQQIRIEFKPSLFGGIMSMTSNFENVDLTPGKNVVFKWERDAGTFFFEGDIDEYDNHFSGEGDCFFRASEEYIDRMNALDYDIDNKDCLSLAIHDITLDFAGGIRDLDYDIDLDRLVEFHIHDVTPEYIREMRNLGYDNIKPSKLVEMRIHNVTPDYIKNMQEYGVTNLTTSELVAMRIHGVDPDYIAQFHELGYNKIDSDKLVEMRIHGVSPEFVSDLRNYGYDNLSTSKLVEMQIHNVDIYFIRSLAELGYEDINPSKLVEMKIHNVTPYYVKQLAEVGYPDIDPSDLVAMRIHGVDVSFIKKLQRRGYDDLTPEELVERKIHGSYRSNKKDDSY